ncbi:sporulation protein [Amycolatopsis keratiniphila]|uniref:sporulation protein n=1 Tax=Amycolatopsis keratiniphila TaxID=129921 RepID=UPI00087A0681|nr:sporulation protein [Amycolatopsis keratiniphila]SDU66113.1 sporulation-control protein [Amycolatopsis keratiniphila]
MVFKKMLQKIGVGGVSVDTVLNDPRCRPGAPLTGEVRLVGGEADAEIEHIALSLATQVHNGRGGRSQTEFHRVVVAGATRLTAKEQRTIPFTIPLPWETPVTEVSGQPLPGMELGLRTEVSIAKAVDKGDLDPVIVEPLPSQDAVLEGFGQLGFTFKSAIVQQGQAYGVRQELPFFQQLDFYPSGEFAGRVQVVTLTLVTTPAEVTVLLDADQHAGAFGAGGQGRFQAGHEETADQDWAARIHEWLAQIVDARQAQMMQAGYGQPGYGQPGYGEPGYGHRERRGPGMGGVVAGVAGGVVGGMLLGEMLDGDDDGIDDEG